MAFYSQFCITVRLLHEDKKDQLGYRINVSIETMVSLFAGSSITPQVENNFY